MTDMTSRTILATAALLATAILPGCTRDSNSPGAAEMPAVPVSVATATTTDIADTFESGGVVQARTTATIMSRILAPVGDVAVAPGDSVRAGQVLISLDGRDLGANARRARAAISSADQEVLSTAADRQAADAALELARSTHTRVAGLQARRSATAQELDDAVAALKAAEARAAAAAARAHAAASAAESARASSDAADTTETFSRLTAPFDGVVTEKWVEPGNMAVPGTPLMRVEDTRSFRLDVRVDESRIAQLSMGASVPVAFDAGADGPVELTGTITEIARAVDADARAFLVKIALPTDRSLRSGLYGRARFSGRTRRALTIPASALVRRGQITSVFVVEKGVAHVRLVNVSGTEVLAGLSEGELVIVSAPPVLTDGRRVQVGGR
jgi:RND family efflux transporter MFP subunit